MKPDGTPIPQRFIGPGGIIIEFDPKDPSKKPNTHGGNDHWHEIDPATGKRKDGHLYPGEPVPSHLVIVDPPHLPIKGLAAATVLYYIISEGTRVFPLRNLIPIP